MAPSNSGPEIKAQHRSNTNNDTGPLGSSRSSSPPVSQRPTSIPYSKPSMNSSTGSQDIRVMVVDDITQTRENIIRSLSFETEIKIVAQAASGEEAICKAVEERPDVILMDVNMPDMDGITATISIRQLVPFTQVIIFNRAG